MMFSNVGPPTPRELLTASIAKVFGKTTAKRRRKGCLVPLGMDVVVKKPSKASSSIERPRNIRVAYGVFPPGWGGHFGCFVHTGACSCFRSFTTRFPRVSDVRGEVLCT